jgi:hypothetical protein
MSRVGVVHCLLVAAIVLGANAGEYPGLTRAAFRHGAREVLPLVGVAVLNLVALDSTLFRAGLRRFVAPTINLILLACALTRLRFGAPPLAFALGASALLLAIGSFGAALALRNDA